MDTPQSTLAATGLRKPVGGRGGSSWKSCGGSFPPNEPRPRGFRCGMTGPLTTTQVRPLPLFIPRVRSALTILNPRGRASECRTARPRPSPAERRTCRGSRFGVRRNARASETGLQTFSACACGPSRLPGSAAEVELPRRSLKQLGIALLKAAEISYVVFLTRVEPRRTRRALRYRVPAG